MSGRGKGGKGLGKGGAKRHRTGTGGLSNVDNASVSAIYRYKITDASGSVHVVDIDPNVIAVGTRPIIIERQPIVTKKGGLFGIAKTSSNKKPSKAVPKKEKKKKKKSKDPNKPAKARSLVRLGSPEKAYDMDPVLQIGMIGGVEHPSDHTATKITCSVLGIATIAVVGLYLYKKRHTGKTKNTETEHSDSVSDPMEDVA